MIKKQAWKKRRLGRTNIYVTPLGVGGAFLGNKAGRLDEELAIATVLRGLELGINLIDTSGAYQRGRSERSIGLALEEWYRRGGKREDVVLSTKTGTRTRPKDHSYDATMRSVEISLEMLKTDYIDVLHVHDPSELEPVFAPDGALIALKELKGRGIIRAIGLGCRRHEFHRRCIKTGDFDVVLTFRDYNLLCQSAVEGVLESAAAHSVGVFNGTATVMGLLSERDPLEVVAQSSRPRWGGEGGDDVQRARTLWEWCRERDVNLLALNLQYCMRETRITSTVVGFSEPDLVEKDVAACFEPIGDDVWRELKEKSRMTRMGRIIPFSKNHGAF